MRIPSLTRANVITLYIKVELDASLWFGTCTNAPLMLEMRLGRRKKTELRVVMKSSYITGPMCRIVLISTDARCARLCRQMSLHTT